MWDSKEFLCAFLLMQSILLANSATPEEWKSRTIYQVLTDRFARTNGSKVPCADLSDYCGGTFQGIIKNLDYITNMGFDAIWISPIIENTDRGYHGYFPKNIYAINPHFGTEQDLKDLIRACHERDVWVMVDVIANHVGPVGFNFTEIVPFNESTYYHPYCPIKNFTNMTQILYCRLGTLPDLDQRNPFVRQTLLTWIHDLVRKYNIDGLRIDTVPYVFKDFMAEFVNSSGVYCMGEVNIGNLTEIASYQEYSQGLLNFPLNEVLRTVFQSQRSMQTIHHYFKTSKNLWVDQSLLGVFIDNHDMSRFLNLTNNTAAFKAALTFSIMSVGIPVVYQGDEQLFSGGDDPANREDLWPSMDISSEMYEYVAKVVHIRKDNLIYKEEQVERLSDDTFYAFSRGDLFVAFTNALDTQTRDVSNHEYLDGTVLCNLLGEEDDDCVIAENGSFTIVLEKGEAKIYSIFQTGSKDLSLVPLYSAFFGVTLMAVYFIKLFA